MIDLGRVQLGESKLKMEIWPLKTCTTACEDVLGLDCRKSDKHQSYGVNNYKTLPGPSFGAFCNVLHVWECWAIPT